MSRDLKHSAKILRSYGTKIWVAPLGVSEPSYGRKQYANCSVLKLALSIRDIDNLS